MEQRTVAQSTSDPAALSFPRRQFELYQQIICGEVVEPAVAPAASHHRGTPDARADETAGDQLLTFADWYRESTSMAPGPFRP